MKTELKLEPFPYIEYYDFFTEEELSAIMAKTDMYDEYDSYLNISNTDETFFKMMQDKAWTIASNYDTLKYHTVSPHNRYSANPEDCYFKIHLKKLKPGFSYPIHADSHTKHMTSVFYVGGNGKGTDLYDNNQQWHSNITWQRNKGYSFIPHVHSHHSYEHPVEFNEPRITIMFLYQSKYFYD